MILFFSSDPFMTESLKAGFDEEFDIAFCDTAMQGTDKADCFIVDEDESFCRLLLKNGFQGRILLLCGERGDALSKPLPPEVVLIQKPFHLRDLKKKAQTVLRQASLKDISFAGFTLNPWLKVLSGKKLSEPVKLTEKEVDLLQYLFQKKGEPVLKENLLEKVWEYSPEMTTHTLETHIYNLRQKMRDEEGKILQSTEDGYSLKT